MPKRWKQHPHFKNYDVSTSGEIRNAKSGNLMGSAPDQYGRARTVLSHNGAAYCTYIHRAVAETFIDGFDCTCRVSFKNKNKEDLRLVNLIMKKTKHSRANDFDIEETLKAKDRGNGDIYKTGSHLYVSEILRKAGLDNKYKSRMCRILILGIVAEEGVMKRKELPKLIPAFSRAKTTSTVTELIKDGKLSINNNKEIYIS